MQEKLEKVKWNKITYTKSRLLYSHHGSGLMRMMELIFTVIYCLIGLALISMGISLMQDQVLSKADWLASEVGMKETEEDRIERYILTKFPDAKFTPVGKGGLKLDFGPKAAERFNEVIVQADSSDESDDTDDDDSLDDDSENTSSDDSSEASSSDSD